MSTFTQKRVLVTVSLAISMLIAAPAYAIFAKLTTSLVSTVSGSKASGNASINQSKYPVPGYLSIKVSNVNVSSGTVLAVNISDCPWYGPVAYLKIVSGSSSLTTQLPAICQVGRLSLITVNDQTTVLLKGGYPWKI